MKKFSKILMAAVLGIFLVAGSSWAIPTLTISSGSDSFVITDNGAGDMSATLGKVLFDGNVGNFDTTTTGLTKPKIGSANDPMMDLNSVEVSSAAGGTLTISWFDDAFTLPDTMPGFLSAIGGTTDGTVRLETYVDGVLLSDLGLFTPTSFSGEEFKAINPTDPFSLEIVVTIEHSGVGTTSFNAAIGAPVPEPATMLLLGVGLIGLAGASRKKIFKA